MARMVMSQEDILKEMEELMYSKPKCDFEHIWNSAIDKAMEIVETGAKDIQLRKLSQKRNKEEIRWKKQNVIYVEKKHNMKQIGLINLYTYMNVKVVEKILQKEKQR